MTSDALITAVTSLPSASPRSLTASTVIEATRRTPFASSVTLAIASPVLMATTRAGIWLRALSFMNAPLPMISGAAAFNATRLAHPGGLACFHLLLERRHVVGHFLACFPADHQRHPDLADAGGGVRTVGRPGPRRLPGSGRLCPVRPRSGRVDMPQLGGRRAAGAADAPR